MCQRETKDQQLIKLWGSTFFLREICIYLSYLIIYNSINLLVNINDRIYAQCIYTLQTWNKMYSK